MLKAESCPGAEPTTIAIYISGGQLNEIAPTNVLVRAPSDHTKILTTRLPDPEKSGCIVFCADIIAIVSVQSPKRAEV